MERYCLRTLENVTAAAGQTDAQKVDSMYREPAVKLAERAHGVLNVDRCCQPNKNRHHLVEQLSFNVRHIWGGPTES